MTEEQRAALRVLVASPKYELIPLKNARDAAEALPARSLVTVTASPSHGIEATFDLAETAAALGHDVVPHLSAHMIRGMGHLQELVSRANAAGIRRAFVVGGDASDRGEFHDGLGLLRALDELGRPFDDVGVPAYPDGHVDIADDVLLRVLRDKQQYAAYMATQMCFDPKVIADWIVRMRADGIRLPVHLGIPGVADITKLMTISARIGVADSARYLRKNRSMLGHLVKGSFGPDGLLESLAPTLADGVANVRALHLFTFNHVDATVAWQQRMLDGLGALPAAG